jgi:hypothetical protein
MNKSIVFASILVLFVIIPNGFAQDNNSPKSIEDKTKNMKTYDGFFKFYWDENQGKIWLEIDKFDQEFLYVSSLSAGVGSNDIGLDRGQLGGEHVVKFSRIGPKVLLVEPNYSYRAFSTNPDEQKSVNQAFAQSVIWGFKVVAETADAVLVDATDFFMNDAHGVSETLKSKKQGSYSLDKSRSAIYLDMCKNFPKNTEFESTLTFTGKPAGREIRSVTPSPSAVTVRQHHSFIELPDDGFKMRKHDPRAGYFGISFKDYATPIDESITKRYIARHRLQKKDPDAEMSEAVKPIVYYLDRGAPEPIRSALIEGASWWNQAFEAAGYKNAFQVKLLPEDADPLDVRYNVIQWVHRSTRGWSYGASVKDPRTGEILKGHVSLGSLRVRQDFLIAEGLLAPYKNGEEVSEDMKKMALARLRQLSAHEVGHTLGLSHNFAASTQNRASVMDYPHPLIQLDENGKIDLNNAYDSGIGGWDKVAITYGYQHFPDNVDEYKALNEIIQDYIDNGMLFITDADARPKGGAHPLAHLWDNGENAASELNRLMNIRKTILSDFSYDHIKESEPTATLEEVLVPMYMLHRYQLEATSKLLGGLNYSYAIKNDSQLITEIVDPKLQKEALDAILTTISPKTLSIPEEVLKKLSPRPPGFPRSRETFKVRTGVSFDPMAAAETAANASLELIFNPQRAARLIEYHSRDSKYLGLEYIIDQVLEYTIRSKTNYNGLEQQINLQTGKLVLNHLMHLATNDKASEQVKAMCFYKLKTLQDELNQEERSSNSSVKAHRYYLLNLIERFLEKPETGQLSVPLSPPDGSPIGTSLFNLQMGCSYD